MSHFDAMKALMVWLSILLLAACGPAPTVTSVAEVATASSTAVPSATPTAMRVPTFTSAPTPTATPTLTSAPTDTPMPTATPTPTQTKAPTSAATPTETTVSPSRTPEPVPLPELPVVWTSPSNLSINENALALDVENPSWSVVNNQGGTIILEDDPTMGLVLHMIVDSKFPKITEAHRVYPTKWIESDAARGLPLQPPYGVHFKVRFNEQSLGIDAPNVVFSMFNKYKKEDGSYNTFNLKLRPDPGNGKNRFFLAPKDPSGGDVDRYYMTDFEVTAGEVYDIRIIVTRNGRVYVEVNGEFGMSAPLYNANDGTLGGFHTGAYSSDGSLPDGAEQWYTPLEVLHGIE